MKINEVKIQDGKIRIVGLSEVVEKFLRKDAPYLEIGYVHALWRTDGAGKQLNAIIGILAGPYDTKLLSSELLLRLPVSELLEEDAFWLNFLVKTEKISKVEFIMLIPFKNKIKLIFSKTRDINADHVYEFFKNLEGKQEEEKIEIEETKKTEEQVNSEEKPEEKPTTYRHLTHKQLMYLKDLLRKANFDEGMAKSFLEVATTQEASHAITLLKDRRHKEAVDFINEILYERAGDINYDIVNEDELPW